VPSSRVHPANRFQGFRSPSARFTPGYFIVAPLGLNPGLGGKITSCGEENLLNLRGDRYRNENILIHEFSHAIHNYGIGSLDRTFDAKLRAIHKKAIDSGLWQDTYAATNPAEYWAEGVQSYFDCNAPPNTGVHNDINTREKLRQECVSTHTLRHATPAVTARPAATARQAARAGRE
jgi:hypothetical protein